MKTLIIASALALASTATFADSWGNEFGGEDTYSGYNANLVTDFASNVNDNADRYGNFDLGNINASVNPIKTRNVDFADKVEVGHGDAYAVHPGSLEDFS